MKLTHNCPKCNKPAQIQAEFIIGNLINYIYRCGHIELRPKILKEFKNENTNTNSNVTVAILPSKEEVKVPEPTYKELYEDLDKWVNEGGLIKKLKEGPKPPYTPLSFYSTDLTKCTYEFQQEGVKFAENTQLNCLIADAMGLGKTIQALVTLKRNSQITYPTLIIVKGATLFQWAREFSEWVSKDFTLCMPVTNRTHLIPGFNVYIISMDLIAKQDIQDKILSLGIRSIIIDEVQNFKDPSAKRTKALISIIKENDIKYKIALSGTPIKNKALEYFTILNILAPTYFHSLDEFKRHWLIPNEKGIYSHINSYKLDEFKELTSKWIIRRERYEVLKNLPALTRDYQIIEITDGNIKNSYNHTLDLFTNWLNDNKTGVKSQELLGWLTQLRAITGQAKCKNAIEWIKDFFESSDESLAIGIQHHSVRDTLYYILEQFGLNPLKLSGEDNVYRKNEIVRHFTNGDNRILVINSIAGGVGLNLQTCANALILERQWSSADEEQFESRFHRDGQKQAMTITYMIAKNTIDEFFHELVQTKRKILVETGIGSEFDISNNIDFLKELSNYVVSHKI